MRKTLLFAMLLIALSVQAQEAVTVKFTAATETGGYVPFTSVMVTDLTQGWMTILNYPDTVLVLSQPNVGVGAWQGQNFNFGAAFPNPFKDETCVPIELSEASDVSLQVIRADGKVVAARDVRLDSGLHDVMVRLSTPGMAFLRAVTPYGSSVARLVCMGNGDVDDVSVDSGRGSTLKRGDNPGVFEPGDLMRYEAFRSVSGTTIHSTVVEQAQYMSETVTLFFAVETPEGAIDGLFTINDEGGKVFFSMGNLQYNKNSGVWSFMEHQYDMVELLGQDVGEDYADQNIVSLFGWGTSGYNHGAHCYQPWNTTQSYEDYHAYGNHNFNLDDQTGQADWGYNAIANGGNTEHLWRTLTTEEWNYVFETRDTPSGIRFAKAQVGNVNGVILLPDDWSGSYFSLNFPNTTNVYYENNPISFEQWDIIEQYGAVFLPAAGYRLGTEVLNTGSSGHYWSSSNYNESRANCVSIFDSGLYPQAIDFKYNGFSVRLVQVAH
ncbi:MAG: hypothetical protein IKU00_06680 [Bacteroidales bacterium]|nr:hypothetical protein [Bacteroidales bacterium]